MFLRASDSRAIVGAHLRFLHATFVYNTVYKSRILLDETVSVELKQFKITRTIKYSAKVLQMTLFRLLCMMLGVNSLHCNVEQFRRCSVMRHVIVQANDKRHSKST